MDPPPTPLPLFENSGDKRFSRIFSGDKHFSGVSAPKSTMKVWAGLGPSERWKNQLNTPFLQIFRLRRASRSL